jgi:NitT/TauT family transport system permease protein
VGALYPIPKIAILPLVMLIFGLGESSKWVIIAIGVFFPILINSMAGVISIEKIYHDVGKNYGANRLNQYLTIALPGALPLILTGIRIGWGIALLLIVAAEFVAAKSGLGWVIWQSWQTFAVEQMYVGIITISVLGFLSFLALDGLGKLLVPWKPGAVH